MFYHDVCLCGLVVLAACVLVAWLRAESAERKAKRVANDLRFDKARETRQNVFARLTSPRWMGRNVGFGLSGAVYSSCCSIPLRMPAALGKFNCGHSGHLRPCVGPASQVRAAVVADGLSRRFASLALAAFDNHHTMWTLWNGHSVRLRAWPLPVL